MGHVNWRSVVFFSDRGSHLINCFNLAGVIVVDVLYYCSGY